LDHYFLSSFIAALSSSISLLEPGVAYLSEEDIYQEESLQQ
jgi:SNF family Na+-dependent transporter